MINRNLILPWLSGKAIFRFILLCIFFRFSFIGHSQQTFEQILQKFSVTGAQISIQNGNSINSYAIGFGNAEEKTPVSDSSVFQAASLSKTVLAYICFRLSDRNILSLDTPLYHYFQYDRIRDDQDAKLVTARMVLHHQTGFPNWATNPTQKTWSKSFLKTKEKPGNFWSYSGEGFMYLQFTIEHLLNESIENIADREVFQPFGMHHSSFVWQPDFEGLGVYGHTKSGEVSGREEYFMPAAAYSLLTSARDFHRFVIALSNGQGLSKEALVQLLGDTVSVKKKNAILSSAGRQIHWAPGVGQMRNELGTSIWHWGDNGDFKCFFLSYPGQQKSIVILTNSSTGLDAVPEILSHAFGNHTWWALQWLKKDF